MIVLRIFVIALFLGLAAMAAWIWREVWREVKEKKREDHRKN